MPTGPALLRLIDDVGNIEAVAMFSLQLVELFLEQDIGGGDVCEKEFELGLVLGLGKRMGQDLPEGAIG